MLQAAGVKSTSKVVYKVSEAGNSCKNHADMDNSHSPLPPSP